MGRHPVAVVNLLITYARTMKVDYCRFCCGGLHGKLVVATGKGKTGTIPAFALGPRDCFTFTLSKYLNPYYFIAVTHS
jgi:hypothetical protein